MRGDPTPTKKDTMNTPNQLTPTQTAEKWGCGIATVYRRMNDGTLPYTQTPLGRYINTTDAETVFQNPHTRPRPDRGKKKKTRRTT